MAIDPGDQNSYSLSGTGPINTGPHCRNCHKGSTDCAVCHSNNLNPSGNGSAYEGNNGGTYDGIPMSLLVSPNDPAGLLWPRTIWTNDPTKVANPGPNPVQLAAQGGSDPYVAANYNQLLGQLDPSLQTSDPYGVKNETLGELLHATGSNVQSNTGIAVGNNPLSIYGMMGFTYTDFMPSWGKTTYDASKVAGATNPQTGIAPTNNTQLIQWQRTVVYPTNWRTSASTVTVGSNCADDGFSWPHRTLGWMMLKDDLFGVNFDGSPIAVGQTRSLTNLDAQYASLGVTDPNAKLDTITAGLTKPTQDLDSVCLDCHNPTIWNATGNSHNTNGSTDINSGALNNNLLLRGLP